MLSEVIRRRPSGSVTSPSLLNEDTLLAVVVALHGLNGPSKSILLHLGQGSAYIDGDDICFVLRRSLQDIELAVHHVGAHVVVLALCDSLQQQLLRSIEVDEVDEQAVVVVRSNADDVSVLSLQGRAGHDDAHLALAD